MHTPLESSSQGRERQDSSSPWKAPSGPIPAHRLSSGGLGAPAVKTLAEAERRSLSAIVWLQLSLNERPGLVVILGASVPIVTPKPAEMMNTWGGGRWASYEVPVTLGLAAFTQPDYAHRVSAPKPRQPQQLAGRLPRAILGKGRDEGAIPKWSKCHWDWTIESSPLHPGQQPISVPGG